LLFFLFQLKAWQTVLQGMRNITEWNEEEDELFDIFTDDRKLKHTDESNGAQALTEPVNLR
jgi:hypothetical protein